MSMKKTSSISGLKRADSSHPDDLTAVPSCTSFKHFGDPVDGVRYRMTEYNSELVRTISMDLRKETADEDTVDVNSSKKGSQKATLSVKPEEKVELGFDLMSLTARRGHFVDHVKEASKADSAGLKHGDLILEVNGQKIRDLAHDEVVQLIRQSSEDADTIHFSVVPKQNVQEENDEEEEGGIEIMKPKSN